MIKQKSSMGTTVRCPRCRHENLAIDIWCARCGTPVDWNGAAAPTTRNGTGGSKRSRPAGLAALAGGLPWRKASKSAAAATTPAPAQPLAPPKPVAAPGPLAPPGLVAAPRPPPDEPVPVATPAASLPAPAPQAVAQPETPRPTAVTAVPAAPASRQIFCPGCGKADDPSNKFCPRCGHAVAVAAAAPAPAIAASVAAGATSSRPPAGLRGRRFQGSRVSLPRLAMPRLVMPRVAIPRVKRLHLRLPHIPMVAWAVAAVLAVLVLAPLAYVLSPGHHLASAHSTAQPVLTKTGKPATSSSTPLAAAIPGVENKTGLKYTTGTCPASGPCLKLASQSTGLNAAAVQFSTAGSGGRQCVGYVYQDAGGWHFLDATCALPGQLSPLIGTQATVHVPGQCANVRDAASLSGKVIVCLDDGTAVRVDGGPNYADGKLWWHLEKNGWMAHDFLIGS